MNCVGETWTHEATTLVGLDLMQVTVFKNEENSELPPDSIQCPTLVNMSPAAHFTSQVRAWPGQRGWARVVKNRDLDRTVERPGSKHVPRRYMLWWAIPPGMCFPSALASVLLGVHVFPVAVIPRGPVIYQGLRAVSFFHQHTKELQAGGSILLRFPRWRPM